MKVNSEKLWDYIFDLPNGKKVRFKVYHDDVYFTEILWNGIEFEWESGTFSSGAFFNPLYDFVPIEEEKEIEEIDLFEELHDILNSPNKSIVLNAIHKCLVVEKCKINELIDEVKKLKEDK